MSWSTDRNGEGWFEKEGEAPEGRSVSSQAPVREAEIETLAEFLAEADGSQWGAPGMRHLIMARALIANGYRKIERQQNETALTERQREKAEQERLCRSEDLHEYLTLKGEIS